MTVSNMLIACLKIVVNQRMLSDGVANSSFSGGDFYSKSDDKYGRDKTFDNNTRF